MSLPQQKSENSDKPEKPKSSTHQAVAMLKNMILDNRLASGTDHLESELAGMLGMSRTPVREATLILEAQGLLEVKPRRGVRILSLSQIDMTEIYEILTELESLSAELAANSQPPEHELELAKQAIEDMDISLRVGHREAWALADESFHRELVRLGGNKRIASIVNMYNDQVRRARFLTLHLRPAPTKSNEDHRIVLDAIRKGDAATARKVHREHRVQARSMLVKLMNEFKLNNV